MVKINKYKLIKCSSNIQPPQQKEFMKLYIQITYTWTSMRKGKQTSGNTQDKETKHTKCRKVK